MGLCKTGHTTGGHEYRTFNKPQDSVRVLCGDGTGWAVGRDGIRPGSERVVFVEPFPNSQAKNLHDDSIAVESLHWVNDRVDFQPFVGIAPGL